VIVLVSDVPDELRLEMDALQSSCSLEARLACTGIVVATVLLSLIGLPYR
jgi:hypothetical protein